MNLNICKIFILLTSFINIINAKNHNYLRRNIHTHEFFFNNNDIRNENIKNNIQNLDFRKFMGTWDVYYTNTIKNDDDFKCMKFYYYMDDNTQFMFKFSKMDYLDNIIEKTGYIHIEDLSKIQKWSINQTNENESKSDFIQNILYVDPKYKIAIISDSKKEKIHIISRKNNDLMTIENIESILDENNIENIFNFKIVEQNNCKQNFNSK